MILTEKNEELLKLRLGSLLLLSLFSEKLWDNKERLKLDDSASSIQKNGEKHNSELPSKGMLLEICVSLTLFLLVLCYLKSTQNYGSFREQGYPEETGYFPFGSQIFWDIYLKRSAIKNYLDDYRQKFPTEKFFIAWDFTQAALFITDPDLGRRILSVDSSYFPPLRKDLKEKQNRYLYSVMPNWTPEESIVKGAEVVVDQLEAKKKFLFYYIRQGMIS
ncbi:unnamed protein product [Lepeophtheirus salmonis]|uniref:(salmon louse) hypothetical protein n=1 Tax=Lepeophtheirus salmonis TaxID=72036 RepID=A0A7R8CD81_LEPSM|nr:unnamed protein product [Lepeophtheirus salmonis]CAF2771560.1 unnamed protein product [Lepeophtheirus salmonis]